MSCRPYLRVIDVGLTPYSQSDFNRASFPLKTLRTWPPVDPSSRAHSNPITRDVTREHRPDAA